MIDIAQLVLTVTCSVLGSAGFWAFLTKRAEKKDKRAEKDDARSAMLVGLAHDRIIHLGVSYIKRGSISKDDYENLYEYLYKPYEQLGGNGSAKRIMAEVNKLPIETGTED